MKGRTMDVPSETSRQQLDYPLSLLIALQTGARSGHCYESAYPAFFACPDLFYPNGKFVEGWVVFEDASRVVLLEHGWLVAGKRIIDVTLVLQLAPCQPVHYFPGVVRSWAETDALNNELFPHVRFSTYGEDGMKHPGYLAAYEAASRKARELMAPGNELIEVRATDSASQESDGKGWAETRWR